MFARRSFIILVSAAFVSSVTLAHGPSRLKVSESIEINVPAAKVWAVIGNFQDMKWHPAVQKTEGAGGNNPEATRKLTLGPEAIIDEQLTKYSTEAMTYSYRITAVDVKVLPVTNYAATLTVTPKGDGGATVEWRGAFYRGYPNNDPPANLSDEAGMAAVSAVYKSGLEALKKNLESGH